MVDHLAALGRKRLIHIAGPQGNIDADERSEAVREACAELGLQCEIIHGDFDEESGARAIGQLLDRGSRFDAVFAANDNMAIGALSALRARGRSVPGDVAVAGFDDIPLARHLGLTTVRVRIDELGERALARLLASMERADQGGEEFHTPELVIRSTTEPSGRS